MLKALYRRQKIEGTSSDSFTGTTDITNGLTETSITSESESSTSNVSDDAAGLHLNFSAAVATSSTDDIITITTQQAVSGQSITPSISWRIPTITTDELPTTTKTKTTATSRAGTRGSAGIVSSSWVASPKESYTSRASNGNISSQHLLVDASSTSSSTSSSTTTSTTSSTSSGTSSTTPSITLTTIPETPTTSSSEGLTTTITHYYEDLTYTQVYIITDKYTSVTTSLLATTTLMIDQLSGTYEISPPAITTDVAAFKAIYDFDPVSGTSESLSGGAKAGVAVGVIFGFLFILASGLYWIKRTHPSWINFFGFSKDFKSDDDAEYGEETGFHHTLGMVEEDDPFNGQKFYGMKGVSRSPNEEFFGTPEMDYKGVFDPHTPTTYNDSPEFSLLNMKSTLASINYDNQFDTRGSPYIKTQPRPAPPPPPPARTNSSNSVDDQLLGLGSIIRDTSNSTGDDFQNGQKYSTLPLSPLPPLSFDETPKKTLGGPPDIKQVLRGTPPPIMDRSMGVVYESANEHDERPIGHIIHRHGHGRHNSDEDGVGRDLSITIPYYKTRGIPSPLKLTREDSIESGSPKSPFLDSWQRARSGSVPKRYESLSESVMNLKQTLKEDDNRCTSMPIGKSNPPRLPPPRKRVVTDTISVARSSVGSSLSEDEDEEVEKEED